jgi:hypothetical protein
MNNPFDYLRQEREKAEAHRTEKEEEDWEIFKANLHEIVRRAEPYRDFPLRVLSNLRDSAYQGEGINVEFLSSEDIEKRYREKDKTINSKQRSIEEIRKYNFNWSIGSYANHPENGDNIYVTVTLEFDNKNNPVSFLCERYSNSIRADLSESSLIEALIRLHPKK